MPQSDPSIAVEFQCLSECHLHNGTRLQEGSDFSIPSVLLVIDSKHGGPVFKSLHRAVQACWVLLPCVWIFPFKSKKYSKGYRKRHLSDLIL